MSNETLVEALRELFVKWLESRSPFRTTVEVEAAWEGWKANTAIAAMLAAEITEPVAWSCQDTINDDDGCPIGMDEPRVHWGSGCPDDDGGWSPLYGRPQPAQDAKDAARYRWLRDKSGRAGSPYIRCDDPPFKPMDYWITAGTADSCIDRAMAKESGNG